MNDIEECLGKSGVFLFLRRDAEEASRRVYELLMNAPFEAIGVAIVSKVASRTSLMTTILASGAQIEPQTLKSGALCDDEQDRLVATVRALAKRVGPLNFIESDDPTVMMADLKTLSEKGQLQVVVMPDESSSEYGAAGDIAGTFEVPVVVGCAPGLLDSKVGRS